MSDRWHVRVFRNGLVKVSVSDYNSDVLCVMCYVGY